MSLPSLLASENSGLNIKSWKVAFEKSFSNSSRVCLITGYVSNESLLRLKELLRKNRKIQSFDLVIGMARKDGLTKSQFDLVDDLDTYLQTKDLGQVLISWTKPVHAKLVRFDESLAIVGSSNLSALASAGSPFEIDLLVEDESTIRSIRKIQNRILESTEKFSNVRESIPLIAPQITQELMQEIGLRKPNLPTSSLKTSSPKIFELPLKYELKSNLNAHAAAPRTKGGDPRSWYEVEIGISTALRALPGFPTYEGIKDIHVITDDGWAFDCHFSGAAGKNFNSIGDLTILGRWIKGRLLDAGAITFGDLYTPEVAKRYGRTNLTLESTSDPKTWIISFAAPK